MYRQLLCRSLKDHTPLDPRQSQANVPLSTLPSWESITPVDMQDRWFLQVKVHVLQDNKPEEVRKAQDQLLSLRNELGGVFDFKTIDRKAHDTRVALPQQGIQALPQKVTLGKT